MREPKLLDHEYDGIREYDNPTPGWWHAIFVGTIVFSVVYFVFFHFSPESWTIHEEWNDRQVAYYKQVFGKVGELKPEEATILSVMGDEQLMAVAGAIYANNCAACHGADGRGINGVNLTDDFYKNVARITDLYGVITNGAAAGAMPAWGQRLSQNERVILAGFVAAMRGRNVPGRGPEGERIGPWPSRPNGK